MTSNGVVTGLRQSENLVERYPLATVRGRSANTQKKLDIEWLWIRMWMAVL